jgi:hypothetical protein
MKRTGESNKSYDRRVEEMSDKELLKEIQQVRRNAAKPSIGELTLMEFVMGRHLEGYRAHGIR